MKKTILVLSVSLMTISCTKKDSSCTLDISGKWSDGVDNYAILDNVGNVSIYFEKQIHSPKKEGVSIEYKKTISNDTIYLVSGNIYPSFYFAKCSKMAGVIEWRNIPTQGRYKSIVK